jgi:hypothetical protein
VHNKTHVFTCIAPDGDRVEVKGAPDREAAERAAAKHFGCKVSEVASRYRYTVCTGAMPENVHRGHKGAAARAAQRYSGPTPSEVSRAAAEIRRQREAAHAS